MANTLTDHYPIHRQPEHLIQFDTAGETLVFWPTNERDRDEAIRHLRAIGAPDFTARSKTYSIDEQGKLTFGWVTVASAGKYMERAEA